VTAAFVVDASVALAWCFHDEATDATRNLLRRMSSDVALVPSLWFLEIANILAVSERKGRIAPEQSSEFIRLVSHFDLEVDEHTERRTFTHVLDLSRTHGLSAYDATYLDLACHHRLPLATLDAPLRAAANALDVSLLGI